MSLASDKRNVFTSIGSFNSMQQQGDLPNLGNTFSSVNNKNEPVPFLLDILKVTKGSDAMTELTGELFTDFSDNVEPQLKDALKNQTIQGNSADPLPTQFNSSGSGYDIPASQIDLFGKFKTNPNSDNGSLLYADETDTFDKKAFEAVSNPDTFVQYNNTQIRYNEVSDTFTLKSASDDGDIGSWTTDFINGSNFIDRKEIVTSALDSMYGTVTTNQGKTQQEILNELKINAIVNKLISGEDDLTLSNSELSDLDNMSHDLKAGVLTNDFGCGLMKVSLTLEEITNTINNVSTSDDPFFVGNEINDTIPLAFDDDEVLKENQETIKDGFFYRLINGLYLIFVKSLTLTPQARVLTGIITAFQNNGETKISADINNDIQNMKTFFKCIIKKLMELLNEFIYRLVINALIGLLKPVTRQIIKEKINSFIGILRSLISSSV